jgi:hypothetical protein
MRAILFLSLLAPGIVSANHLVGHETFPCSINNAARTVTVVNGTLLVCYFGSDPEQKEKGWIYVTGVAFYRIPAGSKSRAEFIAQADENGLGIDYRIKNGGLEIVTYIDTYPNFKAVQFYTDRIVLRNKPARHERRLIYKPARVTRKEAEKAKRMLEISEAKYRKLYQNLHGPGMLYRQLMILRDYAFVDLHSVSAALKKMENYWWNDGEAAEVLDEIQNDVSEIENLSW